MVQIQEWMQKFVETVKEIFKERIVCIGLQGSYGRGEASEDSDIDVVVILDALTVEDLEMYDGAIAKLPARELVCGFVSGKQELENWEKSDLFQFYHDTEPIVGNLDFLLPQIDQEAVRRAVRIGTCNIYHMCVHNFLHEKSTEILKGLYKSAVFVIQAVCYETTGIYRRRRIELLKLTAAEERKILETGMLLKSRQEITETEFREFSSMLLEWSGRLIRRYSDSRHFVYRDAGDAAGNCDGTNRVCESGGEYHAGKRQGEYTLEDYYAMPEEQRVELIDGVIYDMAAPTYLHQILSGEIFIRLKEYIRKAGGLCVPVCSPIDVQLDCDGRTIVQPDVIVLCDREKAEVTKVHGAPDFVAEIVSKSTRRKDLYLKLMKYEQAGVREYWIVDPDKKRVIVYDFEHGECPVVYNFQDMVPVQIFGGQCRVDFSEIYEYVRFLYDKMES